MFDAARGEVERQLSELIKASVQRVIKKVFSAEGLYNAADWSFKPMEMDVRPRGPSGGRCLRAALHLRRAHRICGLITTLLSAIAFLSVLVLLLVLSIFFELRPRIEQPSSQAPAAQSLSNAPRQ